ncbi:cupin domain-containing protein [Streptomyces fuscichromogenes]|uniref:cupin domain-containing protein n=1 Tax=Streptomyces fuscichromogenes TaxID=1324013 RepID=UPI00380F9EA1
MTSLPGPLPDFPGSVGLSRLSVYPWPTADDAHGGTPHMHLACAECYVVVSGRGRLETLSHQGHQVTPLAPGDVVWFTPGTIHRAVNDGDLRVLVVMQNSGLPEAGDAVMTFPPEHLTPQTYPATASVLDDSGRASPERARARRDLALEGFAELTRQWRQGNQTAYDDFCRSATTVVRPHLAAWEETVQAGPVASAQRSLRQISALAHGDWSHLLAAEVTRIAQPEEQSLGMCGYLRAYDPIRRAGGTCPPR